MSSPSGATGVAVLGSTGSIGVQALDVIEHAEGRFRVVALAARRSAERLAAQARIHRPVAVALVDAADAPELRRALPAGVRLEVGLDAVTELARGDGADVVLNAVTGSVGLGPTLAALDAGKRLALANKESLIAGGELVTSRAAEGQIVPVDSEHSALAQCLRAGARAEVTRLVITASGGPFRGWPAADMEAVTPEQALAHPTWAMGPVITVNSATLANKALEVVEAHLLFGIPYDRIDVVVHPQSIVHSMVEFTDGSTIAQLSQPDMRLPIGLALGWPDRSRFAAGRLDWTAARSLTFEPLDRASFPILDLIIGAGMVGGTAPAVANAANEEAVAAFFDRRLSFSGIAAVVRAVLERHEPRPVLDVGTVLDAERWSRALARTLVEDRLAGTPTGRRPGAPAGPPATAGVALPGAAGGDGTTGPASGQGSVDPAPRRPLDQGTATGGVTTPEARGPLHA